jgi:hypothetical protein
MKTYICLALIFLSSCINYKSLNEVDKLKYKINKYILIFALLLFNFNLKADEPHCDCENDDYLMIGLIFNKSFNSNWSNGFSLRYNRWQNRSLNYEINFHTSRFGSNFYDDKIINNYFILGFDYTIFDLKYIWLGLGIKTGYYNSIYNDTQNNSYILTPEFTTYILGQLVNIKVGYNLFSNSNVSLKPNPFYLQFVLNIPLGFHREVK